MHEKTAMTLAEARASVSGPLSHKVLDYAETYGRVVEQAGSPDFGEHSWAPLEALIDIGNFERVGAQKEVMDWPAYRKALTAFARSGGWEGTFRRVTETPGLVFLELIETLTRADGEVIVVNSATVYEFSDAAKLRHLDIYVQKPSGALTGDAR